MRQLGLSACFGIDNFLVPSRTGPVIRLDLSLKASQHLVFQILNSDQLVFVWMAPPCGTASRAREIALSNAQPGPRPLRSDEFPDGILGLQEHDAHRVQKANELYQFVTQICVVCTQKGLSWAVEFPFSSLFWRTSF